MKNIFRSLTLLAACAVCAFSASAQTNPNRLLVNTEAGAKGFLVERIQDITFARVDGEVKANVEVTSVDAELITVSILRTEACQGFRLSVMPATVADTYYPHPDYMVQKIEAEEPNVYYQDFAEGQISGAVLQDNTKYSVVTVGYDKYGIACGLCRADFTTPRADIVGTPKVTTTVRELDKNTYTLHCEPNADVAGYAIVTAEKGLCQQQCAMFGFANFGDMVRTWGLVSEPAEAQDFTFDNRNPGTDYEFFVQAWDAQGTYVDCDTISLHTPGLGDSGEASVSITLGDYCLNDWGGQMLPSQFITFTPDEHTAAYRYAVYFAKANGENIGYDDYKDEIQHELCTEAPVPGMAYWFFYEPLTTDFQLNPNTEYVAIAAGKNAEDVWGKVTELRFTTPAAPSAAPVLVKKSAGITSGSGIIQRPYVPAVRSGKGELSSRMQTKGLVLSGK